MHAHVHEMDGCSFMDSSLDCSFDSALQTLQSSSALSAEAVERMVELAESWESDGEGPERLCYLFQHRLGAAAPVCYALVARDSCSIAFASHAGMPRAANSSQHGHC